MSIPVLSLPITEVVPLAHSAELSLIESEVMKHLGTPSKISDLLERSKLPAAQLYRVIENLKQKGCVELRTTRDAIG